MASVKRLDRPTSNHYPILLQLGIANGGPQPFRFENMWMEHPSFLPLRKHWWSTNKLQGRPEYGFMQKLKLLKPVIKDWNKTTFSCLTTIRNQHLFDLAILDSMKEQGTPKQVDGDRKRLIKEQILYLSSKEEIFWKQKCKKRWLKDGDLNSNFFHRLMNAKSGKIQSLKSCLERAIVD